ncbi:hypothetical protein Tsubulata_032219 [Turnera subulata]|uniref:Uncharacterized protein n=1 Tax=Turnera subulata TaxID=218843 RepID=A0A9Q0FHL0_9ROSI|nr:hypothetical protein Tsubulata_032219 [Turnera subulata]
MLNRESDAMKSKGYVTVPSRCLSYVKGYVTGEHYVSDSEVVTSNSLAFAKIVKLAGDGKDAWVFDIAWVWTLWCWCVRRR